MSTVTVEELQKQMEVEMAAHKAAIDAIAAQTRKLQSLLDDNQRAFTDLVTRVTNLRVAKGEFLAARAEAHTPCGNLGTGSDLLDGFLDSFRVKLATVSTAGVSPVMQKLETAALEAMTPYGARRVSALFTSNAAAVRHTGILLLFPNDVRGVRGWAKKHFSSCPSCAARLAQLPPWTPHRYDSKAIGFAAAPDLRIIPEKRYHHLTCSLVQESSVAARVDTAEQLDLIRGTFFLKVQSAKTGQPLTEAAGVCATATAALQTCVTTCMTELRDTVRTAAPWNVDPTANRDVSTAIEILLHLMEPRVDVQVVPQPTVSTPTPNSPTTTTTRHGAPCTLVQMNVAVTVPLQVSAVAPLLHVLRVPEQRRYVVDTVLAPLAVRVGEVFGVGDLAARYSSVGLKFAEALFQLAVQQRLVPGDEQSTSPSASAATNSSTAAAAGTFPPVAVETLSQLYFVLQALAVFNTTLEVEMATPHLSTAAALDAAESAQSAKKAALHLVRSLLQRFSPPTPFVVPPACEPDATELTVKVTRAPTAFLEIINNAFSSDQRLPATARSSALDTFISLKSKISLGLRLFRELVVDVYRPYHPCTGVVLAAENGVNGRPRAAPCVPVIDLPVDTVAANITVATSVMRCLDDLQRCEAALDTAAAETPAEKAGKAALQAAAEKLRRTELLDQLRAQWEQLCIHVVESTKACVEVVLPFSMTEVDVRSATKPLLYVRVVYES
ncbi:hypothetical protein ABB37_06097 [Leptomonas pyrrhocoris]|uniref:Uncharacterized protein n=1 Tax=Leptomonas pyrrhocoris TaxID=157538 RepID=A0A0N1J4N4_LEPPY|nr:hypothetical protein ABB37_06097 [Leptomonas pyrrhocoris]XP_015656917.1 hypothetical protein ABB37_06097 [Leptomonas pyrrhocoris]XP_015656918.1 hypothetical protein ABB37_06097 [Leptomonas pyrrhocoris]KPA78477.1 hypothetical protein ABB37_06097 [Leptomonas pyrrhocoris]KPA78478.1 hypothetical protein ABB37_06097 [Leptomonas pyrrhocoris]KPA78479.1 hypothetical protein ABB37_06097 [Leptomonas pyrrhocoris]|eukprot:XP_015656916.1 hypothetical protein ABB37_06097 [Leptomonas pyrrhocoris]